jgi:secondary thiamine-phosphate synthase enzyme
MKPIKLTIETQGERFYPITSQIKKAFSEILTKAGSSSGVLTISCMHTSCGLTLNESYDPSAARDMESFLKYLAPRDLELITHTTEGPDDSPSHLKTMLINNSLQIIVDEGELMIGTWQGIFLCEFRDRPHSRTLILKFQAD